MRPVIPTKVSGCTAKSGKTIADIAEARMTSLTPYAPFVRWYISRTYAIAGIRLKKIINGHSKLNL